MIYFQKTINNKVSCCGIALHSGKKVSMKFLPGEINSGIIFKRTDISGKENQISAIFTNVTQTNLGTVISNKDQISVSTIEHIMAAIWYLKIDNLIIEVDSNEVPILDGSSEPFIFLLECAGSKISDEPCQSIEVIKEITLHEGDKYVKVKPAKKFSVNLKIDFNNSQIKKNQYIFDEIESSFKYEISRARTFCFKDEIDYMRSQGLALGGSLDNAIVIDKDKILNEGSLRYEDEFVKHKILDFIGDFYLAGRRITGAFEAYKTGHSLNNKFLRKLLEDPNAWKLS